MSCRHAQRLRLQSVSGQDTNMGVPGSDCDSSDREKSPIHLAKRLIGVNLDRRSVSLQAKWIGGGLMSELGGSVGERVWLASRRSPPLDASLKPIVGMAQLAWMPKPYSPARPSENIGIMQTFAGVSSASAKVGCWRRTSFVWSNGRPVTGLKTSLSPCGKGRDVVKLESACKFARPGIFARCGVG